MRPLNLLDHDGSQRAIGVVSTGDGSFYVSHQIAPFGQIELLTRLTQGLTNRLKLLAAGRRIGLLEELQHISQTSGHVILEDKPQSALFTGYRYRLRLGGLDNCGGWWCQVDIFRWFDPQAVHQLFQMLVERDKHRLNRSHGLLGFVIGEAKWPLQLLDQLLQRIENPQQHGLQLLVNLQRAFFQHLKVVFESVSRMLNAGQTQHCGTAFHRVGCPENFVCHFRVFKGNFQIQQPLLNRIEVVFGLLNEIAHDPLLLFRQHMHLPLKCWAKAQNRPCSTGTAS